MISPSSIVAVPHGYRIYQFQVCTGTETDRNRVIDVSAPDTPQNHAREFAGIYESPNLGRERMVMMVNGFCGQDAFRHAVDWSTTVSNVALERTSPYDLLALSGAFPRLDFDIGWEGDKMYVVSTKDCPYTDGKPCTTRVWYKKRKLVSGVLPPTSERYIALPYTDIIKEPFAWFLFAITPLVSAKVKQ